MIAFGLLATLFLVGPAVAELAVSPSFYTEIYADDNRRVRPQGGKTTFATVTDADLEAVYTRPTYSIALTPEARFSRYTQHPALNAQDWFVNLEAVKAFERHQFTAEFDYQRESTATTELEDSGIILDISQARTRLAGNISDGPIKLMTG